MTKKIMKEAKNTIKLGIVSGAGMVGVGALGVIAPAGATKVTGIVGAGLTLANVGQLGKTGMVVAENLGVKKKKGKTGNKFIDRIL